MVTLAGLIPGALIFVAVELLLPARVAVRIRPAGGKLCSPFCRPCGPLLFICLAFAVGGCDRARSAAAGGPADPEETKRDPAALTIQIDETREKLTHLQIERARDASALTAQFKSLEERRKRLPAGDNAIIAAFNADAAAYQAQCTALQAKKAQMDAADRALGQLLSSRAKLNSVKIVAEAPAPAPPSPGAAPSQTARSGSAAVVIYSTAWCGYCKMAKKHFDERGVSYDDIDIEKSPEGAAKYRALGGGGVPIIVIKGQVIHGYDQARIDALL